MTDDGGCGALAARYASHVPHTWKVGDEVWRCFCHDMRYFPKLVGRVSGLGKVGFTVKLFTPNARGERFQRAQYASTQTWPTEAEGLAWCAEHVGPYGPNGRSDGRIAPLPALLLGKLGRLPNSE